MVLFFSGVLSVIGLIAMFGAGYLLGQNKTPKTIVPTQDEDVIKEQKEHKRQFNEVFSYSVEKAIQRRKVT